MLAKWYVGKLSDLSRTGSVAKDECASLTLPKIISSGESRSGKLESLKPGINATFGHNTDGDSRLDERRISRQRAHVVPTPLRSETGTPCRKKRWIQSAQDVLEFPLDELVNRSTDTRDRSVCGCSRGTTKYNKTSDLKEPFSISMIHVQAF